MKHYSVSIENKKKIINSLLNRYKSHSYFSSTVELYHNSYKQSIRYEEYCDNKEEYANYKKRFRAFMHYRPEKINLTLVVLDLKNGVSPTRFDIKLEQYRFRHYSYHEDHFTYITAELIANLYDILKQHMSEIVDNNLNNNISFEQWIIV